MLSRNKFRTVDAEPIMMEMCFEELSSYGISYSIARNIPINISSISTNPNLVPLFPYNLIFIYLN